MPATIPYHVHVDLQQLICIFSCLPVNTTTRIHAPLTALRGKRIAPVNNGKHEADDHRQVYRNGEVGIDKNHNPTLLRLPVAKLHFEYTTTWPGIQ